MKKIVLNLMIILGLMNSFELLAPIDNICEEKSKDLVREAKNLGYEQELFEYLYYKRIYDDLHSKEDAKVKEEEKKNLDINFERARDNFYKFSGEVERLNKSKYKNIELLFKKANELKEENSYTEILLLEDLFDSLKFNGKVQFKYLPKKNYYISWRDVL